MDYTGPRPPTIKSHELHGATTVDTISPNLDVVRSIETDSFGSAEEMSKVRHDQKSSEYSRRQTNSFLEEMSLSKSVLSRTPLTPPPEDCTRKRTKTSEKDLPAKGESLSSPCTSKSRRSTNHSQNARTETDDVRRVPLEKKVLPAAKGRVTRTIDTDRLRERAHTAVVKNTNLKQEVVDIREEIQSLHTKVLCHVVDIGCRDPRQLRTFLGADGGREKIPGSPRSSEESSKVPAPVSGFDTGLRGVNLCNAETDVASGTVRQTFPLVWNG